jgi:signal transduction histidine kinase
LGDVRTRFFAAAAHELRTPLTAIVGYLEMLLDEEFGPLSKSQHEPLKIVSHSAYHLRAITNNLLTAARLEAGKIRLDMQPRDLPALVRAAAAEFDSQLRTRDRPLELHAHLGLPPALCDERMTRQIISNLLGSVCERAPEGEVIQVCVTPAQEQGFLQIAVVGTGAGLSAADCAELDECCRAGRAELIRADLAHLELCVARWLAELHGGRVWFESGPEQGRSFNATFPVAE